MTLELRLFGGASLLADGQLVTGAAAQPRRIAVLAVLAEAWPVAVTRDRLVGLLWPDQDDAGARRLLTQSLYELRRVIGDVIRASSHDVGIDADAIHVDLIEFRRALRDGDVERAANLDRGPFLDGFYLREAAEFERWAVGVRQGAWRDLVSTLEEVARRYEAEGDLREAARWAERAVAASPYEATTVRRAIDLAERAGDPATALRVAATYEQRVRDDLGLEPDAGVLSRAATIRVAGTTDEARAVQVVESATVVSAPSADASVAAAVAPALAPAPEPRATRFRSGWWAAALGVVTAAALLLALAGPRIRDRLAAPSAPRVVLLAPFESLGDSSAASASSALSAMLVAKLEGSDGTRLEPLASDSDTSASWGTMRGSVVANGRQLQLDAEIRLREPGARAIRASVSGPRDSLIALAERLAIELMPAFYPELVNTLGGRVAQRLGRSDVARRYLDGELALRRGAYEDAHTAFRIATELDSSAAFAWYRRAVAAEDAHRIADADRSAAIAEAGAGDLSPGDRQLIQAYATWRRGDMWHADSLYRRLLTVQPTNAEAWFHFAELSYHGGPLMGRPLDAARDAWRQAIALDSNNVPGLMHAIRLEARAGNADALRALLARVERMDAREPFVSEARAIAAAASSAGGSVDWSALGEMPDASLHFVHAIVAGFLERPALAREPARRLTETDRPDATRAEGYTSLATIAMANGELRSADALLDSAARFNPVTAALWRSYFATLPFLPDRAVATDAASRQLASISPRATAAPLYLELATDASTSDLIHRYSTTLLAIASGRRAEPTLDCAEMTAGPPRDLCADLERGLVAEIGRRAGRPTVARAALESLSMRVPYQLAGRSVYFARTRERFVRAQLLEQAGRLDEAYEWYASTPHASRLDYLYLAPSHLARGRIRAKQGDAAGAAAHYQRVLELWANADEALLAVRREAERGVR